MFTKKLSLLVLPLVATLSLQANDPFFNDPFGDDIFKEMMKMQQDMDKMFNRMHQRMQQRSSNVVSPLGTYKIAKQEQFSDKGEYYEYITNIPENKENQIDINVKDSVMSITAKMIEKHEEKTANSFSSSSSMRMYQQSMPLPNDANESTIKADYQDGKLAISIEKKNSQKNIEESKRKPKGNEKIKLKDNNTSYKNNTFKKKITINSDLSSMS